MKKISCPGSIGPLRTEVFESGGAVISQHVDFLAESNTGILIRSIFFKKAIIPKLEQVVFQQILVLMIKGFNSSNSVSKIQL